MAGPNFVVGNAPRSGFGGDDYATKQLRDEIDRLKKEPSLVATIVEIRDQHMLISLGAGNAVYVDAIKGAKVGYRVLVTRNTMQPTELIEDIVPTGTILTVTNVSDRAIEGEILNMLRAFKPPPDRKVQKGERVILDASLSFVIGTLGMPAAKHTYQPKINVSWDDVGGQDEAKEALREAIELPLSQPDLFRAYGKRHSRGVMLSGPAGTGKTLLAKAAATAIARNHHGGRDRDAAGGFVYVKGPEILSKWIGETEERIRGIFRAAREFHKMNGYPAVVFLDEADALLGSRDRSHVASINTTVVPQFLAEMDGLDDSAAMFILATNRPDMLDPAVVRDGRIDRKVRVARPGMTDCAKIFEIHLRGRPLSTDGGTAIKGEAHAKASSEKAALVSAAMFEDARVVRQIPLGDGTMQTIRLRNFASGAMVAGIVERAATAAMLRDVEAGRRRPGGIATEDLVAAVGHASTGLVDTDMREVLRELASQ